ncbi:MAG: hypothetical protein MJ252_02875, partial [archaeon]|nr:hypothetical protein [archaeon]
MTKPWMRCEELASPSMSKYEIKHI